MDRIGGGGGGGGWDDRMLGGGGDRGTTAIGCWWSSSARFCVRSLLNKRKDTTDGRRTKNTTMVSNADDSSKGAID